MVRHNRRPKIIGGAGYRSRYLSHAKRALYHLSYAPSLIGEHPKWEGVANFVLTFQFKVKVQSNLKDSGWDQDKCHQTFDSSVGRAVDCSCSASEIHRSLVQIRLEGVFVLDQLLQTQLFVVTSIIVMSHKRPG